MCVWLFVGLFVWLIDWFIYAFVCLVGWFGWLVGWLMDLWTPMAVSRIKPNPNSELRTAVCEEVCSKRPGQSFGRVTTPSRPGLSSPTFKFPEGSRAARKNTPASAPKHYPPPLWIPATPGLELDAQALRFRGPGLDGSCSLLFGWPRGFPANPGATARHSR